MADVRAAVAEFVERYNQCWRLEKLAYRTPLEAREEYELRHARVAQTCVQETGLSGFSNAILGPFGVFRGRFNGKALWKLVENAQRFPRCGGRVLCVHGAVSFHRAHPYATRSPRPRTAVDP